MTSINSLFHPKSVAIIGASSTPGRTGYQFTKELLDAGYKGELYLINPKGGDLNGIPIYTSLDEIEKEIDLAIILVNRGLVEQTVINCADHGVKVSVIYSAGFGEIDQEGKERQEEIVNHARLKGMRIVGPNCAGVYTSSIGLNLTGESIIPGGNIGMISQSGGVGFSAWYDALHYLKTGFSKFIGFGNQADVPIHEYIEYLGEDPETKVIVLYIEGILPNMGRKFIDAARKVTPNKPIVAIKGGRTDAGKRAANSHTGALAGSFEIYQTAFKQAGIIEVERLDELIPVAQTLAQCPVLEDENLALIGAGGGHMILSSDAIEKEGLTIPPFNESTENAIKEKLYDFAPRKNPVDLAGSYAEDLGIWEDITRIALNEPNIGGVMLYGAYASYFENLETNGATWETASRRLGKLQKELNKPIVAYIVAGREDKPAIHALRDEGIPTFDSLEIAARCLRALKEYNNIRKSNADDIANNDELIDAEYIFEKAKNRKNKNLLEPEAYELLEKYSVNIAKYKVANSAEEAANSLKELGSPVVFKLCSEDVIHKSDVGGVKINIKTESEAAEAYQQIVNNVKKVEPDANIDGVLVASQKEGIEVIAGIYRDVQFGPVLMVGLGGIYVEILKDVAFRVLPTSKDDIYNMLKQLKGYPILAGVRGQNKVNIDSLVSQLLNLSNLAISNPIISEIDLNPIFVNEDEAVAADARILLTGEGK